VGVARGIGDSRQSTMLSVMTSWCSAVSVADTMMSCPRSLLAGADIAVVLSSRWCPE
jgi:hypothetical protein